MRSFQDVEVFRRWRFSGLELDRGASQGGLGGKALRRPPLLRRVQDILGIQRVLWAHAQAGK